MSHNLFYRLVHGHLCLLSQLSKKEDGRCRQTPATVEKYLSLLPLLHRPSPPFNVTFTTPKDSRMSYDHRKKL
jgi:hypothetical protein